MPELDDVSISCGIRQLSGLCREGGHYDPQDRIPPKDVILEAFTDELYSWNHQKKTVKASEMRFGIVIFSDSARRGNGKRFAKYIEEQGLGTVEASKIVNNPNTRRNIQMWTWYLNRPALAKWLTENSRDKDELKEPYRPLGGYIGGYADAEIW